MLSAFRCLREGGRNPPVLLLLKNSGPLSIRARQREISKGRENDQLCITPRHKILQRFHLDALVNITRYIVLLVPFFYQLSAILSTKLCLHYPHLILKSLIRYTVSLNPLKVGVCHVNFTIFYFLVCLGFYLGREHFIV